MIVQKARFWVFVKPGMCVAFCRAITLNLSATRDMLFVVVKICTHECWLKKPKSELWRAVMKETNQCEKKVHNDNWM